MTMLDEIRCGGQGFNTDTDDSGLEDSEGHSEEVDSSDIPADEVVFTLDGLDEPHVQSVRRSNLIGSGKIKTTSLNQPDFSNTDSNECPRSPTCGYIAAETDSTQGPLSPSYATYGDIATERNPASPLAHGMIRKSIVAKWYEERKTPTQQFAGVLRHTERADATWAEVEGDFWHNTDDMKNWPLDPPLSDNGVEAAREMGQRVAKAAEEFNTAVDVVVSSPFLRCIQTAIEVCCKMGPKTRLLVDYSLSEIYGPCVMGLMEPQRTTRSMDHILQLCRSRGVDCEPECVGQWPCWPENVQAARRRFATRYLTYLQRSLRVRRNFLIVSHADCVGASLSMMPAEVGSAVNSVEYGGMFLAHRLLPMSRGISSYNDSGRFRAGSFGDSLELTSDYRGAFSCRQQSAPAMMETEEDGSSKVKMSPDEQSTVCDSRESLDFEISSDLTLDGASEASESDSALGRLLTPDSPQEVQSLKVAHGWRVQSHDIQISSGLEIETGTLERRLKGLVDEQFPRALVEKLLVTQLPALPLDGGEVCGARSAEAAHGDEMLEEVASLTNSTLLFGLSSPLPLDREAKASCKDSRRALVPSWLKFKEPVALRSLATSRIAQRRNCRIPETPFRPQMSV
jgi:broad specificity phosphatase PhoE